MLAELDKAIREKGVKKAYIAYVLGISAQCFSNKLYGRSSFMLDEAVKILDILEEPINGDSLEKYFFVHKVERKCRECVRG